MITIYTYPNCGDCVKIKEHLDAQEIEYNEINAVGAGRQAFIKFYGENKEAIDRDKGGIILPVVHSDGQDIQGVEKIVQEVN